VVSSDKRENNFVIRTRNFSSKVSKSEKSYDYIFPPIIVRFFLFHISMCDNIVHISCRSKYNRRILHESKYQVNTHEVTDVMF